MIQVLALLIFSLSSTLSWGQTVDVQATVDRNQVGPGDVINLTVAVTSDSNVNVDDPRLPPLSGFELINMTSGQSTSSTYQNGQFMTQQTRTFNYLLAIQQKGTLTIPPIAVIVNGQEVKTKPIQIAANQTRPNGGPQAGRGQQRQAPSDPFEAQDDMEEMFQQMLQRSFGRRGGVPGGGGQPREQNIDNVNPNDAFFIQAEADKTNVTVGEQITASFYLYTRGDVRDIDTLKYPDLKGFWKEEIEMATRLNFENVVVNGIAYHRALLVSYALFPIKAGKAIIDPYKAKCTVLSATSFGFGRPYVFTKASRAIDINVADVPLDGKPKNFTGAVGKFRLSAVFEPPSGTTNQPITLRIRIEGNGNAKLIELPTLPLPPSFELYDQKSQAKFLRDGTSFKEFEVLILPREPGVFDIPPVTVDVYDPDTHKYTDIMSQPLKVSVTGQATVGAPAQAANGTPTPQNPSGPVLPPLSTNMSSGDMSQQASAGITAAFFLAALGVLGWQGRTQLRRKPKKASLQMLVKRRLKSIRDLGVKGDWRRFGVEMTNAAYFILGQVSGQGGAHQELSLLLDKAPPSLRNELGEPLRKLLSQCEALSFAPEVMVAEMTQKNRLDSLLNEFEKVMNRAIELAEI